MRHTLRWMLVALALALSLPCMDARAASSVTLAPGTFALRGVGTGSAIGSSHRLGIGLQGGPVSGLSLKYFMSPGSALQIGLGGSGWGWGFNLEYLIHPVVLARGPDLAIPGYIGLGVGAGYWHHGYWGWDYYAPFNVHVPIGLAFQFTPIPIDIFLQAEPGVGLSPIPVPIFGATLGARIFF